MPTRAGERPGKKACPPVRATIPRLGDSRILADIPGSDHCPVELLLHD